jgi:hypothetical protein
MPSETTKRKLKAFQFIDGAPEGSPTAVEHDKENEAPQNKSKQPNVVVTPAMDGQMNNDPNENALARKNDIPSTPVNQVRLPLQHLLANVGPKILQPTLSPHLQGVGWKQPTPPQGRNTPGKTPRRSKKRARSSSPPGSNEAAHQKYKTPKQDPAAEVWSRFRGDAKLNDSAMRASQDGIEALILNSSPRSSETVGNVGGLRRYNSCGLQFPTSRKKRKIMNPGGSVGNIIEEEETEVESRPHPRISKIGQLLQAADRLKAQQQEQESPIEEAGSSISSPPPVADEQVEEARDDGESPLRHRGTTVENHNVIDDEIQHDSMPQGDRFEHQVPQYKQLQDEVVVKNVEGEEEVAVTSDHEFSDMDFDEDDLDDILDPAATSQQIEPSGGEATPEQPCPVQAAEFDTTVVQKECLPPITLAPISVLRDDEFGDNEFADYDFSDDAWDQVAASITVPQQQSDGLQPTTIVPENMPQESTAATRDEFDADDFDDDDFLKAEALSKGNDVCPLFA